MAGRLSIFADRMQFQPAVLWDPSFAEWMIQPIGAGGHEIPKMDMALLLLTAPRPCHKRSWKQWTPRWGHWDTWLITTV